jgi:hypothetical protein
MKRKCHNNRDPTSQKCLLIQATTDVKSDMSVHVYFAAISRSASTLDFLPRMQVISDQWYMTRTIKKQGHKHCSTVGRNVNYNSAISSPS